MSKRFFEPFQIAHDKLVGVPKGRSQEAANSAQPPAATVDDATHVGEDLVSEEKNKNDVTQVQVSAFREQCELACQKEFDSRVVVLVA